MNRTQEKPKGSRTLADLIAFADELRANPTKPEAKAMAALDEAGIAYLTQAPFGWYIFDIVIPSKMLVVEIDGWSHAKAGGEEHDKRRDAFCEKRGLSVLRISDGQAKNIVKHIWPYDKRTGLEKMWETVQEESFRDRRAADTEAAVELERVSAAMKDGSQRFIVALVFEQQAYRSSYAAQSLVQMMCFNDNAGKAAEAVEAYARVVNKQKGDVTMRSIMMLV